MNKMITLSAVVEAPLQTAWDAFTQPEHVVQWNHASDDWHCPSASNDLRVGGRFNYRMEAKDGSFGFDFWGDYTDVQDLKGFDSRLGDGRALKVEFEALGSQQTRVSETFELENQNSEELQRGGWQAILDNFKQHAESLRRKAKS
jgi:uncharacterized protein YndB with AHSA1/START domain